MRVLVFIDGCYYESAPSGDGILVPDDFDETSAWREYCEYVQEEGEPVMHKNQYGTFPSKSGRKIPRLGYREWLATKYDSVQILESYHG